MTGSAGPLRVRTPRMLVRPLEWDDRREFVRTHELSREHFARWAPVLKPLTWDEAFERSMNAPGAGEQGDYHRGDLKLVGVLDDGRIAGYFSLNQIYRGPFQNTYAGWKVPADCTGRGLGTEGVSALLDVAFAPPPDGLGLHRVQANIAPGNELSLRLAARCGFREEGLGRAYLQIAAEWCDHVMLAKLASEHRSVFGGGVA